MACAVHLLLVYVQLHVPVDVQVAAVEPGPDQRFDGLAPGQHNSGEREALGVDGVDDSRELRVGRRVVAIGFVVVGFMV
jgi:hypothetical protein